LLLVDGPKKKTVVLTVGEEKFEKILHFLLHIGLSSNDTNEVIVVEVVVIVEAKW